MFRTTVHRDHSGEKFSSQGRDRVVKSDGKFSIVILYFKFHSINAYNCIQPFTAFFSEILKY